MGPEQASQLAEPPQSPIASVYGLRWEPLSIDAEPVEHRAAGEGGRSAVARSDSLVRRTLGLADLLGTLIAFEAAALIGGVQLQPLAVVIACVCVLGLAKILHLYDRDPQLLHKNTLDEYPKLVGLGTGVALAAAIAGPVLASPDFGRLETAIAWALLITVVPCLRSLGRRLARGRIAPERCLFLGNPADAAVLQVHLRATAPALATIIGAVDVRRARRAGDREYPSTIAELAVEHGADRVILASELAGAEDLFDIVRRLRDDGLKVSISPTVSQVVHTPFEVDRIGGTTLLGVPPFELTLSTKIIKRSVDIGVATMALIAALPILIATAIAIRLDSGGPILYRQLRVGRRREQFTMLKFRSMVEGAHEQRAALRARTQEPGLFKLADDPRITRVGRLIRKLSIDELPQLLNVLRGEMSIVGPRPLPVEEDAKIGGWGGHRLEDVRPGMTGPWQLLGGPDRIPLSEMIKLDIQYVSSWSLWSDCRIALLTLGHIASRRGH